VVLKILGNHAFSNVGWRDEAGIDSIEPRHELPKDALEAGYGAGREAARPRLCRRETLELMRELVKVRLGYVVLGRPGPAAPNPGR
jgi:hypothetical protein